MRDVTAQTLPCPAYTAVQLPRYKMTWTRLSSGSRPRPRRPGSPGARATAASSLRVSLMHSHQLKQQMQTSASCLIPHLRRTTACLQRQKQQSLQSAGASLARCQCQRSLQQSSRRLRAAAASLHLLTGLQPAQQQLRLHWQSQVPASCSLRSAARMSVSSPMVSCTHGSSLGVLLKGQGSEAPCTAPADRLVAS